MKSNTLPFSSLKAKASFKGSGITSIVTDEFFMQNDKRDLQQYFEQGEATLVDSFMRELSAYAAIPDILNRELGKPKIELIEKHLIELVGKLEKRKEEVALHDRELQEAQVQWRDEARPYVDGVLEAIENLKSSIAALDQKCIMLKYEKGTGATRRYGRAEPMAYIKKSGFEEIKKALNNFGVMY